MKSLLIFMYVLSVCSIFTAQPTYANITDFNEFKIYCDGQFTPETIKKEATSHQHAICEAYIKGYLAVANHNCEFDIYSDDLHKLDTTNISTEQITKAWEIYHQNLPKNIGGNIIDHLWRALSPHWPCQKR